MSIPVGYSVMYAKFLPLGSIHPAYITCGARSTSGAGPSSINNIWRQALTANAAMPFHPTNMSSNYSLVETGVLQQADADTQTADVDITPVVGTATLAVPPANVVVNVQKVTLFAGPRFRGRMACPAVNVLEGNVDHNGIINSTQVIVQQGFWDMVWGTLVASSVEPKLLHQVSVTTPPSPVPPPTNIASFRVTPLVGTLRGRIR